MEWRDLLLDGFGRIPQKIEEILKGLSSTDLDWQPAPECNTIGWTVWHLARVQDAQIADLLGKEQVYIQDQWFAGFKRPADPKDTGYGDTPQDVAGFKSPGIEVLSGYVRATNEQSRRYIISLSQKELERVLNEPWFQPQPTVAVRLVSILTDGHQHVGEASYIRGLRKAMAREKIKNKK